MLRHLVLFLLPICLWALAVPARAAGCDALTGGARDACLIQVAQSGPDCAMISRATHRLACWDRLHRLVNCPLPPGAVNAWRCGIALPIRPRNVEIVSASADTGPEGWTLVEELSAFTDTMNVFLSVPSDRPMACGPRRRATLMLRCLDDHTAIYVAHDCATPQIGRDGWDADLRLDDRPVEEITLTPTHLGDGFGHFDYRSARTMIERLEGARVLHLRFKDIEGYRTEMSFPIAGLSAPLAKLKSACAWSAVPPWAEPGTERARP